MQGGADVVGTSGVDQPDNLLCAVDVTQAKVVGGFARGVGLRQRHCAQLCAVRPPAARLMDAPSLAARPPCIMLMELVAMSLLG